MRNVRVPFVVFFIAVFAMISSCSSDSGKFKFNPETLDFGSVNLDESKQLTLEITNKYGKSVLINDLVLSNTTELFFISGRTLPIDLEDGATHTLTLQYTPISAGSMDETLSIKHNASEKSTIVTLIGEAVAVPRIQFDKTSHDFSYVLVNTAATCDINITNSGTAELTLNSMTFSGSGASGYSVTSGGNVPVVINPGVIHKVTIEFYPITDVNYSAELSIDHDSIDGTNPTIITLSGDGKIVRPKITLNRTGLWDFGVASAAAPVSETLEIENTGTDDLTIASLSFSVGTSFSVTAIENTVGGSVSLPAAIAPSAKIIVTVKFEPTASAIFNDTLSIYHDGINVLSPVDLSVTGEGKYAISKSFAYTGAFDTWTVPTGVTSIRIEAWGAQGGGSRGGKGARVRGDFTVSPGEVLTLIVGENGYVTAQGDYGAGGGGGSYVYRNTTDSLPIIVAGGGGGQVQNNYGADASHTDTPTAGLVTGSGNGGTGGNGGDGGQNLYNYSTGGGGAGWLTDGKDGVYVRNPEGKGGQCPRNGATGGIFTHNTSSYCAGNAGDGGFGGGGGMSDNSGAGGGGGGWNGGGGGNNYAGSSQWGSGGGAGSYNNGSNKDGASGVQSGNGKIVISY